MDWYTSSMRAHTTISFEQSLSDLQCILIARRELASSEGIKLTWLDFDVMDCLIKEAQTPSQLSEYLHTSRSSMSKRLKYLRDNGLVTFEISTKDGRSRIISLTGEGRGIMDAVYAGRRDMARQASQGLTPDEQQQFAYLAQKIATALDEDVLHTI
jgi:DNA-binding MarR family transcriptional regulator